ncbi:MAG: S46 family peptidase [Bacteroidetes bacterium]|nr:S46 family peptidase [Bacteroidota bacterium]
MKKIIAGFLLSFIFILHTHGQEGMWLLSQLPQLDLAKKGMKIGINDIYSKNQPALCQAVLQLGGGSASFVSSEGLIVTNHHVAFTALQRASSVSSDYLTKGFLATKKSEEIKAPGYQAQLMTEMKDVTDEVTEAGKGISDPLERDKKINAKIAQMTDAIEKDKVDVRATVSEMYNGKQYVLYVYKIFKDIRIVYSPPLSIGNYGGETDNWMWPRHTGDFSFMRAYVAPDGTGKEYSAENVPYKPKVWLKVAKDNLKDGDLTFIVGYPGFTTRYRSSTSVHWNQEYNYPFAVKNFKEIIALSDEITKNDPAGKLKEASLIKGLANVMKNYEGKLEGMKKTNFLQKKLDFEKDFQKWANSDPERKAKYADILAKEKAEYTVLEKTRERDNAFSIFQGLAGTPLSIAGQILYLAQQSEKPESERDPGFNDRTIDETIDQLQYAYENYYEPVDKALMVRALKMAHALPPDQRITGLEYVFADKSKTIEQFVDEAFKTSKMNDVAYVKTLFRKSVKDLEALNDPFMKMTISIDPMAIEIQKTNRKFGANVTALRKVYLEAIFAWKGTGMYPDANSTIRFTSGNVKGYKPRNAVWYYPLTTLQGVVEKNTGEEPFDAPQGLVDLYQKKDFGRWSDPILKDVPVAFLSQCDITGGNSGSPVMNANGELVGVVFDGNYEAMISDWQYDYNLQRAISVDIRYVLYVTEKFGNAGFILDEMNVPH